MLAKTYSAAIVGIDGYCVHIEVESSKVGENNLVNIVGLPDASVRESRDRVRAALNSSGFPTPVGSVLINLAPGDLRKEGAAFDLPIAAGMLAVQKIFDPTQLKKVMLYGELSLSGKVRPAKGALPVGMLAAAIPEIETLIVPQANAVEAAIGCSQSKTRVYGVDSLTDVVELLRKTAENRGEPVHAVFDGDCVEDSSKMLDFSEVKGQMLARRALEIAAAGGHNVLMYGPPGTGKSMLAARLPSILPPMTMSESLETSRIHSVLGILPEQEPLLRHRPFRSPHHTISDVGLIGGGRIPMPGEISLAHNGVLFLDELPEFKRNVLEVMRQPLETGSITISRANGSCTFPARVMLVGAMNPCPCGFGDAELGCHCKPDEKRRYLKKISGPLLDRIDLQVEVLQLTQDELLSAPCGEDSAVIRARVVAARVIQQQRFAKLSGCYCNAMMNSRELQEFCNVSPLGKLLLRKAIATFKLSPRAYNRILKVARTIADLAGSVEIQDGHLLEAINYRSKNES